MSASEVSSALLEGHPGALASYRERIADLLAKSDYPSPAWSLRDKLGGRELVLYGAGEGSHLFVETVMALHGLNPALVMDKRFVGDGAFHGVPACAPDSCAWSPARRRNALVVVATGKAHLAREMADAARALGFGEVIPMMAVYEVHQPFSEPQELDVEGYGFFRRNAPHILDAFDLLQDEQSRAVFWGVLHNHCTRAPEPLPMRPKEEHNFPGDLPFSIDYSRYLCGGGADEFHLGELVCLLAGRMQRMVVVDPMIERISLPASGADVTFVPCALDDCDELVPFTRKAFERGTTYGCRVLPGGETFARATRIDTLIGTLSPSFISMDIEGGEERALKGARRTIATHRPTLAICVYHSVDHLWKIPLLIHSFNLGYRFWVRNYCSFTSETVVYAYAG